jgi:hypothetical protein
MSGHRSIPRLRFESLLHFGGPLGGLARGDLASLHRAHLLRVRWTGAETAAWHLVQAARCRHAFRRVTEGRNA